MFARFLKDAPVSLVGIRAPDNGQLTLTRRRPAIDVWRGRVSWPFVVIGVIGTALRAIQYLADVSLWVDEAAVARNVVDGSFASLLHPLHYGQVAPLLFLWVERAAVLTWGPTEHALRLVPFLASVAALAVFIRLARGLLPPAAALASVWMFALAVPLIFFGSQVKAYALDVLVTLVIVTVTCEASTRRFPTRDVYLMALLGLLELVSHVAVLVLAGVGLGLASLWIKKTVRGRDLLVMTGMWGLTASVPVLLARANVGAQQSAYLDRRWADAFMPIGWSAAGWVLRAATGMIGNGATDFLDGSLHYPLTWLVLLFAVMGFGALWRTRPDAARFFAMPAAVALAASSVHAYPFTGRFVIFLLPFLLILVAFGATDYGERTHRRAFTAAGAGVVAVLAFVGFARTPPVQHREDIKPVLAEIRSAPADRIYVYYGAAQSFLFYTRHAPPPPQIYAIGRCARGRPEMLLEDLGRLNGLQRVWIVIAHASAHPDEPALMLEYLDAAGVRVRTVSGVGRDPAVAYLYDLGHGEALGSTTVRLATALDRRGDAWQCAGPMTSTAE